MILAKRRDGITAIELMAVIAILGILIAVGVMSFRDYYQREELNRAVQEMVADLMVARQRAKTQMVNITVDFNFTTAGSYLIVAPNETIYDKVFEEIDFAPTSDPFFFNRMGRVDQPVDIVVGRTVVKRQKYTNVILDTVFFDTVSVGISRMGKITY